MRKAISLAVLLLASLSLQAKDKPAYEKGELLQMDSASCGFAEKGRQDSGWAEFLAPTDSTRRHRKRFGQEYVLRSQRVTYRIRPKDDKHPALLPVGETAEFRIHKDKLLLRVPDSTARKRVHRGLHDAANGRGGKTRPGAAHANR